MLNFEEEIKKFKPSLDVDDIEEAISGVDLTDMNDIMVRLMLNAQSPLTPRPRNNTGSDT